MKKIEIPENNDENTEGLALFYREKLLKMIKSQDDAFGCFNYVNDTINRHVKLKKIMLRTSNVALVSAVATMLFQQYAACAISAGVGLVSRTVGELTDKRFSTKALYAMTLLVNKCVEKEHTNYLSPAEARAQEYLESLVDNQVVCLNIAAGVVIQSFDDERFISYIDEKLGNNK